MTDGNDIAVEHEEEEDHFDVDERSSLDEVVGDRSSRGLPRISKSEYNPFVRSILRLLVGESRLLEWDEQSQCTTISELISLFLT